VLDNAPFIRPATAGDFFGWREFGPEPLTNQSS
jgi:hypothetical protein